MKKKKKKEKKLVVAPNEKRVSAVISFSNESVEPRNSWRLHIFKWIICLFDRNSKMSIKSEIVHYFFNSQMCGLCWNCKRTCLMLLTNTQYSNLINASPFGVKTVFLFASSSRQPSKTHFPFKSFKMRSSSYSSRLMNVFFHFLSVH